MFSATTRDIPGLCAVYISILFDGLPLLIRHAVSAALPIPTSHSFFSSLVDCYHSCSLSPHLAPPPRSWLNTGANLTPAATCWSTPILSIKDRSPFVLAYAPSVYASFGIPLLSSMRPRMELEDGDPAGGSVVWDPRRKFVSCL